MPDQDVSLDRDNQQALAEGSPSGHDTNGRSSAPHPAHADFLQRLDQARNRFDSTVATLREATFAMSGSGVPPDFRLIQQLGDCHRIFTRLRGELLQTLTSLQLPVPDLDSLGGLVDLHPLIDALTRVAAPASAVATEPPASSPPVAMPPPEPAPAAAVSQEVPPDEAPPEVAEVEPTVASPPEALVESVGAVAAEPHADDVALETEASSVESTASEAPPEVETCATADQPIASVEETEASSHFEPLPSALESPTPESHETSQPVGATLEPLPTLDERSLDPTGSLVPEPPPAPPAVEPPTEPSPVGTPAEPDEDLEAIRTAALDVLDTVKRLAPCDGVEFPALVECREQAHQLRETIAHATTSELPPEARQIAAGEHVFVSLLRVVAGVEDLTDAQWASHHARISEAFGRPLAVAVARSRLVFRG